MLVQKVPKFTISVSANCKIGIFDFSPIVRNVLKHAKINIMEKDFLQEFIKQAHQRKRSKDCSGKEKKTFPAIRSERWLEDQRK